MHDFTIKLDDGQTITRAEIKAVDGEGILLLSLDDKLNVILDKRAMAAVESAPAVVDEPVEETEPELPLDEPAEEPPAPEQEETTSSD